MQNWALFGPILGSWRWLQFLATVLWWVGGLKQLPSVGVAGQTKPADTIHDFSFPAECQISVRTPTRHLTSWDSSQWQSDETLLDMQKDVFWICCSDYLVLQRGEPRDVLMDVQGWDSCKTWGHIRGGGRRAERDLQVSGQNLINTFTPHENSPFLKMPK